MTAARYLASTICALAFVPALAAPAQLGDPFHVRHSESVELAHGVKLKFIDIHDGRCAADVTCIWQGEASVEVELQASGQTARASITTEKPELVVLAHRVRLLGVYPAPRSSEQRPAKESVAFLRVADSASTSAKPFANRDAALAAAGHFVSRYARAAKEVCTDWQQRQLITYVQDSSDLCGMISKVAPRAHAFNEDSDRWGFYFPIDNPQMHTQMNEPLYLVVVLSKAPKNAFDQVRLSEVVILPCDVTRLDATRGGCNAQTP